MYVDSYIVNTCGGTFVHIPYLSILKPGSNTCRGSNICQVVQQNERNKCLGLFKRRVPKLLYLINLKKWCQTLRKISLFSISLLIFAFPFRMLLQLIVYSIFIAFVIFPHQDALMSFTTPISEWSPYTFIKVLASNHTIKLINTGTSTCHSTLVRWTIEN